MYDTMNLYIPQEEEADTDFISEIPCFLSPKSCAEGSFANGVRYVSGRVDNMYVRATEQGLFVSGSLCKYLYGNNYVTPSSKDVGEGIERLSDALHYDIGQMPVTRLDIATNIITEHPFTAYTHHFGSLKGTHRFSMERNILYKAGNKTFEFEIYDKNKEHREKEPNVPIPVEYQGNNVARLEYRCKNRKYITRQFAKDCVSASDLCTLDFFNKSVGLWGQMYGNIKKVGHRTFVNGCSINDIDDMALSSKDFDRLKEIIFLQVCYGGDLNKYCDATKAKTKAGALTSVEAFRRREKAKDAMKLDLSTLTSDEELTEFDKKVKEMVAKLAPF